MVDTIQPFIDEISTLKKELPIILRKILIDRKQDVLRILKDEQLGKGLGPDGNVIGIYTPTTEAISIENQLLGRKPRKPKVAGQPYNFEDTGGFFDGMDMFFEDLNSYSLFSKDEKSDLIEKEYGDIFKLTKKNNEIINNEILKPEMYNRIVIRLFL